MYGLTLQEAEQLAVYFEEVLHHEHQQMKKSQSPSSSGTSIGQGFDEEFAFEDPEINPNYTDLYDD